MKPHALGIIILGMALASCGNLNSVHRTLDTSKGKGVLIDIKQRAILAVKDSNAAPVVCAEPSPDALSAYAFDLAAEGNLAAGKSIGATLGSAESAAFVGLRTQSIQLLRDQFFRACEAYMNKAITAADYNLLIRRYQKQTAALLAIEQLTSVITVPAAVVSSAGSAQGSSVSFLQHVFDDNKEQIKRLEKDRDAAGATDDRKKTLQAEIDGLKKQNTDIIDSIKTAVPSKVATTTSSSVTSQTPGTTTDVKVVADAVNDIVQQITQTDDFIQLCIIWLEADKPKESDSSTDTQAMRDACVKRIDNENKRLALINETAQARISVASSSKISPETRDRILKETTDTLNDYSLGVKSAKPTPVGK